MTDRELMQQALNALENHVSQRTFAGGVIITNIAIALRERLAQWDALDRMVAENERLGLYEPPCATGSQCLSGRCPRCEMQPTWNVSHAATIRCLYAAIDRIRAGDEPAEIFRDFGWQFDADAQTDAAPKLDANPPQRKPLTDEQIGLLVGTMQQTNKSAHWLARAVEQVHRIGGVDE